MNTNAIEERARRLLMQVLEHLDEKKSYPKVSPFKALDPELAAQVLGIEYVVCEELGAFGRGDDRFEPAGIIDRQANRIAISRKFPDTTRRFTAAHELGHWLLHRGEVMHRDRPRKGFGHEVAPKDSIEREADFFAACFLMPRKLVFQAFAENFGVKGPYIFDAHSASDLYPIPPSEVGPEAEQADRAHVLAIADRFQGRLITPLAQKFNVSAPAMAKRLLELELIY